MKKSIVVFLLFSACVLSGCAKGNVPIPNAWKNVNLDAESKQVMAVVTERDRAYTDKDYDAILAVYADGALIHYAGQSGPAKQYSLDEWKRRLPGLLAYWTLGAVEYASYKPTVSFLDDGAAKVECKYVVEWLGGEGVWDKKMLLKKVQGQWKIFSD